MQDTTRRMLSGGAQVVLFLALIGASLAAAGLISNNPRWTDPPGVMVRLWTYLTTNVAETTPDSAFPELRPRTYAGPVALIFDVARRAALALHWELTSVDADARRIEAVATTKLIGFQDDVTIWVTTDTEADSEPRSTLYVRSASRVGRGDFAANARRVMDLFATTDALAPVSTVVFDRDGESEASSAASTDAPVSPGTGSATNGSASDAVE